jgi:hypothetical protein
MLASASPHGWVADSRCVVIGQGSNLFLSVCVCARALNPCSKQSLYNNLCYACCGDGTQSSHQQRILVDAGHDLLQLVPFCRFDLEELGRQEVLLGVVVRLVDCLL